MVAWATGAFRLGLPVVAARRRGVEAAVVAARRRGTDRRRAVGADGAV